MKRVSKKGFTLVEMMLAIAIMLLISGLFISLIISVKDSFYQVYNDDDSSDYAMLYAQALENQLLYDAQNGYHSTYYVDDSHYLFTCESDSDNNQFDPSANSFGDLDDFNQNRSGGLKWRIYMNARYDSTNGLLNYTFYMVDNYNNPNTLVQTHSGSVWIPTHGGAYTIDGAEQHTVSVTNAGGSLTVKGKDGSDYTIQPVKIILG